MPVNLIKYGKYLMTIDSIEIIKNPIRKNSKVKIKGTTTKEVFFKCQ